VGRAADTIEAVAGMPTKRSKRCVCNLAVAIWFGSFRSGGKPGRVRSRFVRNMSYCTGLVRERKEFSRIFPDLVIPLTSVLDARALCPVTWPQECTHATAVSESRPWARGGDNYRRRLPAARPGAQ